MELATLPFERGNARTLPNPVALATLSCAESSSAAKDKSLDKLLGK